jgi:hypothetical protein
MSDFYERRGIDYIKNYSLSGDDEEWFIDEGPILTLRGVRGYFEEIHRILGHKVQEAFDVGVGPAAREVLRFLQFGWSAYGCDRSRGVVDSARQELVARNVDPTRVTMQDVRCSEQIGSGMYDLISCFNVIQHFVNIDELCGLASACRKSTAENGVVLMMFKRSDFDANLARKTGLQIKAGKRDGEWDFYDTTFMEWRSYRTFDTSLVQKIFEDQGFQGLTTFPPVLKFFNSRKMPCAIVSLRRGPS